MYPLLSALTPSLHCALWSFSMTKNQCEKFACMFCFGFIYMSCSLCICVSGKIDKKLLIQGWLPFRDISLSCLMGVKRLLTFQTLLPSGHRVDSFGHLCVRCTFWLVVACGGQDGKERAVQQQFIGAHKTLSLAAGANNRWPCAFLNAPIRSLGSSPCFRGHLITELHYTSVV